MKLNEFLDKLDKSPFRLDLPAYVQAEGFDKSFIKIHGRTLALPDCWGVVEIDGIYRYFKTDPERGYISFWEDFDTEESLVKFLEDRFSLTLSIVAETQTKETAEFLMEEFGYSKQEADEITNRLLKNADLFIELSNYRKIRRMGSYGEEIGFRYIGRCVVEGHTALQMMKKFGYTVPQAYSMMAKLRENPEEVKKELVYRFIMVNYAYSKADALIAAEKIMKCKEVYDEFYEFIRSGKMGKYVECKNGLKLISMERFNMTAEEIVYNFHTTELEAYLLFALWKENVAEARKKFEELKEQ